MSTNRPAADRIRPILAAMERSIDAARRRRTVQDRPDDLSSARPMPFGNAPHMTRPGGQTTPSAAGPSSTSSSSPIIGQSNPAPRRPLDAGDDSLHQQPPSHSVDNPLDDHDDDEMPRRMKARPKRPSSFFNNDDESLHSRAG